VTQQLLPTRNRLDSSSSEDNKKKGKNETSSCDEFEEIKVSKDMIEEKLLRLKLVII
jgi:hypothetical protein